MAKRARIEQGEEDRPKPMGPRQLLDKLTLELFAEPVIPETGPPRYPNSPLVHEISKGQRLAWYAWNKTCATPFAQWTMPVATQPTVRHLNIDLTPVFQESDWEVFAHPNF